MDDEDMEEEEQDYEDMGALADRNLYNVTRIPKPESKYKFW